MKTMSLGAPVLVIALAGCLTVNVMVTFPEAQLQSVADEIVEDVQQDESAASSHFNGKGGPILYASASPVLFAQAPAGEEGGDINITVSNAKIQALKKKMKARFPVVKTLKDKGVVGENLSGYLEIRKEGFDALPIVEKSRAKRAVKAENVDRKALYLAVLEANERLPEELKSMERVFARSWYTQSKDAWFVRKTAEVWITAKQWRKEQEELKRRVG